MNETSSETLYGTLDSQFAGFHNLMPNRVHHVLLVSSMYESFILQEDGLLNELIVSEYMDMHLSRPPHVTQVSSAEEALEFIREQPVDLVISMIRIGSRRMSAFARAIKEIRPNLPVVMLAADYHELSPKDAQPDRRYVDRTFVWNGDAKILLAIVKFVEDQLNVQHDTRIGDVRVLILVENSVRFYSAYLPLIYTEVVKLTQQLMAEGANLMHRMLRQRARPKILLAETFEEAWELYCRYEHSLLGVISDIRFPRNGALDPEAGLEITRRIRQKEPLMPVLLQSSDASLAVRAAQLGACFLCKTSPTLLQDLRAFLLGNLGFGEFVFTMPDGTVVGSAHDLRTFEKMVAHIPAECYAFHAQHNHFSNWLMARTEFELAATLRPRKVSDFESVEAMRRDLLDTLREYNELNRAGVVADFSAKRFDVAIPFTRIGGGSLGGKARGLAFINVLIRRYNVRNRFENVRIAVPKTAVIGTSVFDAFLDQNDLHDLAVQDLDDAVIAEAFVKARLPEGAHADLTAFLNSVRYPLAVRSSSLLEDSLSRPFAGIYMTHMLANNHPDLDVRLEQLCAAIKLVYASTFFRSAKRYLETTGHRADEEKMGVILQELVGSAHGAYYYPTFSGVARSYNFYPAADTLPEDGVANVALGLGKLVVDGGDCLMFCPACPQILPQFPTAKDFLDNSQRDFIALDVSRPDLYPQPGGEINLARLGLDVAERDGVLAPIASVYSAENDAVYDGISRPGPRLVTFAHVLKADLFPLAEILKRLLEIGRQGMSCPVEIEFAVEMSRQPMEFGFLQIRPISSDEEYEHVHIGNVDPASLLVSSPLALGNGRMSDIRDIVCVMPETFDSAHTMQIAAEIGRINDTLRRSDRRCLLIGPGRWGTADRWLGIPVAWEQISCARVIVETSLRDFFVAPSQGAHFFHNLSSLRIGYLTVNPTTGDGFVDWEWLSAREPVMQTKFLRHIHLSEPLEIRIDGRNREAAIFKPAAHTQ